MTSATVDVREFLALFPVEDLATTGILRGATRLLNFMSIDPLLALMPERGVLRIEPQDRGWFLTTTGEFSNPLSAEAGSGRVDDLGQRGNLFNFQNRSINPHYSRLTSSQQEELEVAEGLQEAEAESVDFPMDIREFLEQFTAIDLAQRGILRGPTGLLNGFSIEPLLRLMAEHSVARIESQGRDWFLTCTREFSNPLSSESTTGTLENLVRPGSLFQAQNRSINPHYARGIGGPQLDESEDESDLVEEVVSPLTFRLEQDLQEALRVSIDQLEPGLRIVDGGRERVLEGRRRIDITAEDENGRLVVIELKRGPADLGSVGQLLSYMGSVNVEEARPVRGVLIAGELPHPVVMAARVAPNISLKAYTFRFSFTDPT